MIVQTQEQYNEIPDGTIMKLVQTGDGWDDEKGKVFDVIKTGDTLREVLKGGWYFSERDDVCKEPYDDYGFIVIN